MSSESLSRAQIQVAGTAFAALFSIVGLALYGLPFFYDFMVTEFGWTRAQVTSGNAYSKLAAIRDRTGSYGDGFLLLLVLAVVGATAVALLPGGSQRTTNAPAAMREAPPAPSPAVH